MNIAVIEDSAIVVSFWTEYLSKSGHSYRFYKSRPDELPKVQEFRPDVVFCPGVPMKQSGFELGLALKSGAHTRDAAVVVCTTLGNDNIQREWDPTTIDAILVKPFTREAIDRVLDQMSLRHQKSVRNKRLAVVVDDSRTARRVLEKEMIELGFEVVTAENGKIGYDSILQHKPDIVLTDIDMPEMTGYQLCAALASNPETNRLPVLVISASVSETDIKQGFESGVIDYLRKPLDVFKLSQAVANAMGGENKRRNGIAAVMSPDMKFAALLNKLYLDAGLHSYQCNTPGELEAYLTMIVPDIITLDMSTRSSQAADILRKIREHKELKATPIVGVVEQNQRGAMVEYLRHGVNDFLSKPFTREEFNARIQNLLRVKTLYDELLQRTHILEGLAFIDGLTGLLNRRYLETGLQQQFERAKQNRTPLSAIMIDLDHFKKVNDNYGHAIGDEVLKEVAKTIKKSVRNVDIACRYGGEELCVLLPGAPPVQAREIAEHIRKHVEQMRMTDERIQQTISLGVSTYPDLSDPHSLLSDADQGLYQAKASGRNRVFLKNGKPF